MSITIPFQNTYAHLPDRFFTRQLPIPVAEPKLIGLNKKLANELGLDLSVSEKEISALFSGNSIPDGASPLSQVYAAHQFGGWVPQLGDGRAVMLGEVVDTVGQRRDIQLKGSGRTAYSRNGDGRSWLGPVLREYVVSEAMHAFGVPTTRALAAVATGETVQREKAYPGGILTRVASSHIRVGTFQYFAARQDVEALEALYTYVVDRHYPAANSPLELLDMVIDRQASLVAKWMSFGFIHGVMNTDNTAISGETIDYGPCAFMDKFHPETVFSSIDQFGRYAYNKQPDIAVWNLAQFASCLLPLMGEKDQAIAAATTSVHHFPELFTGYYHAEFAKKIGLSMASDASGALVDDFLMILTTTGADFTNSFRALAEGFGEGLMDSDEYVSWHKKWQNLIRDDEKDSQNTMLAANPAIIPRNHRIEEMIQAAIVGNYQPFHKLNTALQYPYEYMPDDDDFRLPPEPEQEVKRTFCGT